MRSLVAVEDDGKEKSMKRNRHIRLNELDQEGAPVFLASQRETLWFAFDYWKLAPREMRPVESIGIACEQGYVFAGGPVELTARQQRVESGAGAGFIVEPTRCDHVLKNLTNNMLVHVLRVRVALWDYRRPLQMLRVRVEMDVDSERQQNLQGVKIEPAPDVPPKAGTFDAQALTWRDAIHGGCGQIATRHVLSPADFYSDWTFLDHAILGAGGSVGYHYHDFLEESFVVLRGRGLMTIADETFAVGPGSVTWQGIGEGHGMYNPGPKELEFVRIAVKQADEEYTTVDLHDDLSARRPR